MGQTAEKQAAASVTPITISTFPDWLIHGIETLPGNIVSYLETPSASVQAVQQAAASGNVGGAVSAALTADTQSVWNALNIVNPINLFKGTQPLTQDELQGIYNQGSAQIDQAAAGNTQLANQAKAQFRSDLNAAAKSAPAPLAAPSVTIPSLADLSNAVLGSTSISWGTIAFIAVAGVAAILVLKQVVE